MNLYKHDFQVGNACPHLGSLDSDGRRAIAKQGGHACAMSLRLARSFGGDKHCANIVMAQEALLVPYHILSHLITSYHSSNLRNGQLKLNFLTSDILRSSKLCIAIEVMFYSPLTPPLGQKF